ncbi:MAG TPA: flagellar biosynthesis protein FliQ [Treponemataceae bacterium]|jgi:flagellar biosynthesis protein FliQ|nr:flagellar biosynthesis protein FliQ [Spirochaetaceae bacterium]HOS29281.1 flagellar biosynthesis protein FliQ [Treponemataceae bacterium]HPX27433.1 flagellar biosynthesis protein FliQ [Treponemataceae bacterium]HQL03857.1 flagellar biosynthesis protein FliQ [Treponemataceae bacterium]
MELADIVSLLRDGIFQILILVAPILGTALVVGLIIAIFQATTSIQEQTLTFVPKLFSILGVLALLGAWMFASLRDYTLSIFALIPQVAF